MTHKDKVRLAHKMRTPTEVRERISIFQIVAWTKRRDAIQERIKNKRKN